MRSCFLFVLMLFASMAVMAESRYIADDISTWVRSGPSEQYRLVTQVSSGSKVDLLQVNQETGYSQIRLDNGRVVWIESDKLQREQSSRVRLQQALAEIERLKTSASSQVSDLEKQLELARTYKPRNDELQTEVSELQAENARLTQLNASYQGRFRKEMFTLGAIVVGSGFFVGWLFGRVRRKNRNSSWS